MRVYELADELKLAPKELMTRVEAELGIKFKSHSASVMPEAVSKIKALLQKPEEKKVKPKAFIIKKAKEKKEEANPPQTVEQTQKQEEKEAKEPQIKIIEQPKLKSKLEIVRPAPVKTVIKNEENNKE